MERLIAWLASFWDIELQGGAPSNTHHNQAEDVKGSTPPRQAPRSRPWTSPIVRAERIRQEILMIGPRFSQHEGICFDERTCDWMMIPKYPLPEKWRNRWCKLLIVFPQTYPLAPPIGFYLNRRFRLKSGGTDSHLIGRALDGAPDLQRQGWHWYCVRMREGGGGGWQPSADYRQPDNLWTFLAMVRESLTNDF